jgi:hypothetical protein
MKIKFSSLNSRHGRNKENYIMKRIEIVKTLVLFDGEKKKKKTFNDLSIFSLSNQK